MATTKEQELAALNSKIELLQAELAAIREELQLLPKRTLPARRRWLELRDKTLEKSLKPLVEEQRNAEYHIAWDARTR